MKIQLINRSPWPTPALNVLCLWIAKRQNLPDGYRFLIKSAETGRRSWGGCAPMGGRSQRTWVRRRWNPEDGWPYCKKDWRFQWSPKYEIRSRVELLVFILSHEAHHRFADHSAARSSYEFRCNEAGAQTVEALRVEWPELRAKIYRAMRQDRDRTKTAMARKAERRSNPSPKLSKAQEQLAAWQRKAKLAATKIKKYRKRVRYYEGKMAACQSA